MIQERQFRRDGGVRSLYRACAIRALRVADPGAANRWPDDPVVELVLRAASSPTTLADTPELAGVLTEFIAALVPYSAAAGLFALATGLAFGDNATIALPRLSDVPPAEWVWEGAPMTVVPGAASAISMTPYKIGTIVPLSNEMMRSSSAEAVVRDALLNNVGPALDRSLFGAVAGASGLRPPGLLYGVAPTDAVNTSGNKSEDMVADLQALVEKLGPYGGNGNIALIASPKHAVRLMMRGFVGQRAPFPLLISASHASAVLIAVAAAAVAFAIDPPRIDASGEVLLHMESANPLPIVDDAGLMAEPVRSTWQTDSVGLRFTLPVSWALRAPAVAWMLPTW